MKSLSVFLLSLLALSSLASGYTLDTEHPLYPYAKGIYVFDNRIGDGNNIAGTGTMVGTAEDADGFDTPITQTFQSWYNDFGDAYTFCIWHGGQTLGSWAPIIMIHSTTDDHALILSRNGTNAGCALYHQNTQYLFNDLLVADLESPMMFAFTWADSDHVSTAYDGNDVMSTHSAVATPKATCTDAEFTIGGAATVTRVYIFNTRLTPAQLGALEADPNSIFSESEPSTDPPTKAANPSPGDGYTGVVLSQALTWGGAEGADNYDLYFGPDVNDIADLYIGNVETRSYDPNLEYETGYHWRVDANNAYGLTTGDVWTFTTATEVESGAVEDFDDWTLVSSGGYVEVTDANVVTVTNMPGNQSSYLYRNFGDGYFGGDFAMHARFTVTKSENLCYLGIITVANSPRDYQQMIWSDDDAILVYWRKVGTDHLLYLTVLDDGSASGSSVALSVGTEYFVTLNRDDDAGANDAGLATLYVCTGAQYGAGGTLVDTLSVDIPSGEQNDYTYVLTAQSMSNQGTTVVSGTISDLNLGTPQDSGEDPEEPQPGDPNEPGEPGAEGHGPYYVSPNGSDDANGVTVNTPWRTLAYALDHGVTSATESYNVIYLMPGNHGGIGLSTKTWDSDSWNNEWRIEGMTGAELSGLVVTGVEAFLDFNDITIRRPNPDGSTCVAFSNSQAIKFRNSQIYGNDGPTRAELTDRGIWINGEPGYCEDITIDGVELWDMNRAIHVYKDVRNDIVIQNCFGHRLNEDFIYIGDFASTRGDYDPIKVWYNKYPDHPDTNKPQWDPIGQKWVYPHGTGLSFRGDNVHVRGHVAVAPSGSGAVRFYEDFGPYNNVIIEDSMFFTPGGIYGTVDPGYARNAGFYQIGTGCKIVNTTFISGITQGYPFAARRYAGNVVLQPHTTYDNSLIFKNNIVVAFIDMGGMTVDGGNNLIYSLWQNGAWASTWDDNDVIVCTGASTIRSGYTVDWFEQVGNVFIGSDTFSKWWTDHVLPTTYWDFALPSDSNAVDAGQPSADSGYDVRGLERDASPDIGAFEYISESAPLKPTTPIPANGATSVSLSTVLHWSGVADNWNVYIGTSPSNLVLQANVQARDYEYSWTYGTTYYWRIDANNSEGTTTGDMWSFTTVAESVIIPGQATNPQPSNGANNQPVSVTLRWSPVDGAVAYNVYLWTSTPDLLVSTTGITAATGTLEANTTYYWRVDSVGLAVTTTGQTWSFTTYNPAQGDEPGTPTTPNLPAPESVSVRSPEERSVRPNYTSKRYLRSQETLQAFEAGYTGLPGSYSLEEYASGYVQRIVVVPSGSDTDWSLTVTDSWGAPILSATGLSMVNGVLVYDVDNLPFADGLIITIANTESETVDGIYMRFYVREVVTGY